MTPEEAIKHLSKYIDHECYADYFQDVCKTAIEALNKQVPKEPEIKTIRNVKYPLCPECGRVLWGKEYYCGTCGQAMDRGE